VKSLLEKNKGPYLAVLCYQAIPLENGFSPAELLMDCKIRTTVPILPNLEERESHKRETKKKFQ